MLMYKWINIDPKEVVARAFDPASDENDRNDVFEALATIHDDCDRDEIEYLADGLSADALDGAIALIGRLKAAKAGLS